MNSSILQPRKTVIQYRPNLIKTLCAHHQSLLELFTNAGQAAQERDYHSCTKALKSFRRILRSHLFIEDIRLYSYLEYELRPNMKELASISQIRRDMRGIAKAVNTFLDAYDNDGIWTEKMRRTFPIDHTSIAAALMARIELEESSLYTLYQPRPNG